MKIGVLTGGGDCPGLNSVIRAVTKRSITSYDYDVIGIQNGWEGLVKGRVEPLSLYSVSGILPRGGTILGTSRTNPLKDRDDMARVRENIKKFDLGAIIAIGGDDTLSVAHALSEEGLPMIGVPKTIDNDLGGTDYTFGFDTAVSIVTEAIDRLHTTAESHHRIMVVEVMGRHAGWIAIHGGIAGGADMILVPEKEFSMDEVCESLAHRHKKKNFSIVVVAEGAKPKEGGLTLQSEETDAFGHVRLGGIGQILGKELEKRLGIETRVTILGHVQRGGTPTCRDRFIGTMFGICAVDLVHKGEFGRMVALSGAEIIDVPIEKGIERTKQVGDDLLETAKLFFR